MSNSLKELWEQIKRKFLMDDRQFVKGGRVTRFELLCCTVIENVFRRKRLLLRETNSLWSLCENQLVQLLNNKLFYFLLFRVP